MYKMKNAKVNVRENVGNPSYADTTWTNTMTSFYKKNSYRLFLQRYASLKDAAGNSFLNDRL